MPFDPGVGSATGNSLVSVERSDVIAEEMGLTDWLSTPDEILKKARLVRASRRFNTINWCGSRSFPGQKLSFPRKNLTRDGEAVDPLTIPEEIEIAIVLFADDIGINDSLTASVAELSKIASLEVDVIGIKFDKSALTYEAIPPRILIDVPKEWICEPEDTTGMYDLIFVGG